MHKRFPGVTSPKKVWAQAPWAKYVIKVAGVYIAFSGEEAFEYVPDTSDLHFHSKQYIEDKKEQWQSRSN